MSNDTSDRAAELFQRLMQARSPQERVRMGLSMFDTAREVVRASLRERTPAITPGEERVQLFLRFYEADLSPAQVRRLVVKLRGT